MTSYSCDYNTLMTSEGDGYPIVSPHFDEAMYGIDFEYEMSQSDEDDIFNSFVEQPKEADPHSLISSLALSAPSPRVQLQPVTKETTAVRTSNNKASAKLIGTRVAHALGYRVLQTMLWGVWAPPIHAGRRRMDEKTASRAHDAVRQAKFAALIELDPRRVSRRSYGLCLVIDNLSNASSSGGGLDLGDRGTAKQRQRQFRACLDFVLSDLEQFAFEVVECRYCDCEGGALYMDPTVHYYIPCDDLAAATGRELQTVGEVCEAWFAARSVNVRCPCCEVMQMRRRVLTSRMPFHLAVELPPRVDCESSFDPLQSLNFEYPHWSGRMKVSRNIRAVTSFTRTGSWENGRFQAVVTPNGPDQIGFVRDTGGNGVAQPDTIETRAERKAQVLAVILERPVARDP